MEHSCCVTLFHGQFPGHPWLIFPYLSFSIFLFIACLPAVTILSSQINCAHFILNWSSHLLSLMHFCRRFTTSSRLILLFSLCYLHVIVPYSTSAYLYCVSLLSIEVFNAIGIVSHCGDWQSGLDHHHSTDGIGALDYALFSTTSIFKHFKHSIPL